jgi:large subunit ribosomal protein L20
MRVTNSPASRKRRMRTIKAAKGFRLKRSKLYRYASDALDHGLQYAYRDRKDQEAQLPRPLAGAHQRRGARRRHDLQPLHGGTQGRQVRAGSQGAGGSGRHGQRAFGELVQLSQNALKAKAAAAKPA